MNFKELRIGNWVAIEPGWFKQWDLQDYNDYGKDLGDGEWSNDKVEPITLTPEILEKAGFKFYEKSEMYEKDDFMDLHILYDNAGYCIKDYELNIWSPNILYLHQLQNLYFALTGEELEINL
jgi:hypothetical protein